MLGGHRPVAGRARHRGRGRGFRQLLERVEFVLAQRSPISASAKRPMIRSISRVPRCQERNNSRRRRSPGLRCSVSFRSCRLQTPKARTGRAGFIYDAGRRLSGGISFRQAHMLPRSIDLDYESQAVRARGEMADQGQRLRRRLAFEAAVLAAVGRCAIIKPLSQRSRRSRAWSPNRCRACSARLIAASLRTCFGLQPRPQHPQARQLGG